MLTPNLSNAHTSEAQPLQSLPTFNTLSVDKGVRKKLPVDWGLAVLVEVICLIFFLALITFAVADAGFLVTFWVDLPLSCWTFTAVDDDDYDGVTRGGKLHSRYNIRTNPQTHTCG